MKSSFLLTLIVTALTASVASAQLSQRPSKRDLQPQKSTFEKFSERLKIGYFGVLTTPTLDNIEKGNWDKAALSPEFSKSPKTGKSSNEDSWPTNIWHQLSFNFNFGAKMNFVVNPRFVTPLYSPESMGPTEDHSILMMEDWLVGFQGVVYSSPDKAFNLWIRPGLRLPTSRGSINSDNGGAGTLTHQLEVAYLPTYDFNKTWQVGLFGQLRQWVYEDRYDFTRFRIYSAPYVQYTFNDVSRLQVYYEHMWETNRRGKQVGDRDPVFKDVWQNVFAGFSYDVTKKFNVMPFVATFVNDNPIDDNSVWFGAWISWTIK